MNTPFRTHAGLPLWNRSSCRAGQPRFRNRWLGRIGLAAWVGAGWVGGGEPGALHERMTSNPAIGGIVEDMAWQPDGRIVVVGVFAAVQNQARSGVARLQADGRVDPTFDPGTGLETPYGPVGHAVVLQPDGKVLVGGEFKSVNGMARAGLVRLQPDGSVDLSYRAHPVGSWESDYIIALAPQPDGRVVVSNWRWVYRLNPDGSLDTTFRPAELDWNAQALALQADGRILLGGYFDSVNGVACPGIARLQGDGRLDTTFDPGTGPGADAPYGLPRVEALAVQPDGRILVAGSFATWSGVARGGLARLEADGGLDTTFASPLACQARALACQPNGQVIVAGELDDAAPDGTLFGLVARVNAQGAVDETFHPEVLGNRVSCLAVGRDGGVLLGGLFEAVGDVPRQSLAHLEGGMSPTIVAGPDPVRVQAGSSALFRVSAAGSPPLHYALCRNGLPVLEPQADPELWLPEVELAEAGAYRVVVSNPYGQATSPEAWLHVDTSGRLPSLLRSPTSQAIVEGGHVAFETTADGTAPLQYQWFKDGLDLFSETNRVLRRMNVGTADAGRYAVRVSNPFGQVTSQAATLTVWSPPLFHPPVSPVVVPAGASVVLSVEVRASPPLLLQWCFNGAPLPGATQPALTVSPAQRSQAGLYTLLASNAVGFAQSPAILLSVWEPGGPDLTFQADLADYYNYAINAVVPQADGRLLVAAGPLEEMWWGPRSPSFGLLRLEADGRPDPSLAPNLGPSAQVRAVVELPDGRLLVGGRFFGVNSTERNGLARLHPDGSLDVSFEPATAHALRVSTVGEDPTDKHLVMDDAFEVWTLAVQEDGKVLAGGRFDNRYPCLAGGLVRFNPDGSLDPSLAPPLGLWPDAPGWVKVMALQKDGRILVAGSFPAAPTQAGLVRLQPDGRLDPTFDPGTGPVHEGEPESAITALALQPDGRILVGGAFTQFNGQPRPGLVRLQPDGGVDPTFDPKIPPVQVEALALQPDGKVLAGGKFPPVAPGQGSGILRLHAHGELDLSFRPGTGVAEAGMQVRSLALCEDGRVLVGGDFARFDGVPCDGLVRLHGHVAPAIVAQPEDVEVMAGYPVSLRVEAKGSPPLHYQWRRNGTALPGETAPTLSLGSAQPANAGLYSVVVENHVGQVTSRQASLLVPDRGRLSIGYAGKLWSVVEGSHVTFQAEIQGTLPYGIQWSFNDQPIASATNARYTLRNAQLSHAGSYACTVTNPMNVLTGQAYTLRVVRPPRLTAVPTRQQVPLLAPATLQAEAEGDPTLGWQWWDDAPIPGATGSRLTVPATASTSVRTWTVTVSNAVGLTLSPPLRVISGRTGDQDPSFTTGLISWMDLMLKAPDDRILVGHDIMRVAGVGYDHVARLTPDGLPDLTFETGGRLAGYCDTCQARLVAVLANGQILAEDSAGKLVRLNADGSWDRSFAPASAHLGPIDVCTSQPDGKLLVVTLEDNQALRRLQADGRMDYSFAAVPLQAGTVRALVQPDGRILVWGEFSSLHGQPVRRLARLEANGTLDPSFQTGTGPDGPVQCLALQSDGRILVGGPFSDFNGVESPGLFRLLPDGRVDPSFEVSLGEPYGDFVILEGAAWDIEVQPDGRIWVGGYLWLWSTTGAGEWIGTGLARFQSNGRLDPSFPPLEYPDLNWLDLQSDGCVLLGRSSGLVRVLGNVPPAPFVTRHLPAPPDPLRILLDARPQPTVAAYAVQDQFPHGWAVSDISHDGVFDAHTGKVKFGPFYDAAPRLLSYLLSPPPETYGSFEFSGQASADGVTSPITGDPILVRPGPHPADEAPVNWAMAIHEVTGYGAAWRRGQTWIRPPNPIPIDFVTRAGTLWREGECYAVNPEFPPPLWWIPCPQPGPQISAALLAPAALPPGAALRSVPATYLRHQTLSVTVAVTPSPDSLAYAVQDQFPAGWSVTGISDGGETDATSHQVKWGPFLDALPRFLHYQLTVPGEPAAEVSLQGLASFDGLSVAMDGPSQLRAGCGLVLAPGPTAEVLSLTLRGKPGCAYRIETSTDLANWILWQSVTLHEPETTLHLPSTRDEPCRFFRARLP